MSELAERWRALLPAADAEGARRRIVQGTAFYRSGRVAGLRIGPGRASGGVQGATATPYHVEVLVEVLDEPDWEAFVETVGGELRLAAALLAGRWPDGLADTLAARGVDLAGGPGSMEPRCPCGEADRPCAHLAALWEALADRIAEDPFVLLRLRGRGRQRILADLAGARRAHTADPGQATRLDAGTIPVSALDPGRWSSAREDLAELDIAPLAARPDLPAGPLRLLGDPPAWAGPGSARDTFAPLVEQAARYAERVVRGEDSEDD